MYQLRKFAKRNRALVGVATGLETGIGRIANPTTTALMVRRDDMGGHPPVDLFIGRVGRQLFGDLGRREPEDVEARVVKGDPAAVHRPVVGLKHTGVGGRICATIFSTSRWDLPRMRAMSCFSFSSSMTLLRQATVLRFTSRARKSSTSGGKRRKQRATWMRRPAADSE